MAYRFLASRGARRLLHVVAAMLLGLLAFQPALAGNDQYRQDIEALRTLHAVALPAGIITPPPFDKPAELTEYGSNIALKFVPMVVEPPPPVVVRPNNGDCAFRYMAGEHPLDPVFDVEDIFGFPLGRPSDWGRLDDGAPGAGDERVPSFFHYNTGAYVTVRRSFYAFEPDPEPWYPEQTRARLSGHEILFTNTNDRQDIVDGRYGTDAYEEFPVGTTALEWEAENKIDILFDVAFQPLIFVAEMKFSARAASKARKTKRFARNWGDPAIAWRRSIDQALWRTISRKSAVALGSLRVEVEANQIENASGRELTNWPTGTFNRVRQDFMVLDEIPPVVEVAQQPAPFEANTLGGEFGNRHFDELRGLLRVRDTCDRPVDIDAEPRGTRFWPINQTTTLKWCGRDPGPNSAAGGRNEACVDINVQVVDTRPPLLLAPPSVNVISAVSTNSLDVGNAGVFDVADPDVAVGNDAPATFPVGRTPVTWTATDSSGNTATATQWVNVKPSNLPPQALPKSGIEALSFEETRIDLDALETESAFDGRYDQLSFRIEDAPDNGYFVAPLFPFFIDDHRQHRINPDGTYQSYFTEAQAACTATGAQPDRTVILEPIYVTVNDAGVMYVMDSWLACFTTGTPHTDRNYRIARFVPDANGELQYANQFPIGEEQPGDNERHLFIDDQDNLWVVPRDGTQIIELDADLVELRRIEFRELTKINPVTGSVEEAFPDMNRRVQAVAYSRAGILYATDGAELHAYDLSRRQPGNPAHYLRLPSVVFQPGRDVDTAVEEPWASYYRFLGGGYADLVLDSDDNIYVSDPVVDRIWKFSAMKLSADRSEVTQLPLFEGWLGRCDENLDPTILACDTTRQQSIGFSCEDDLCGTTQSGTAGSTPGQFQGPRGIAMSPQDVLYVTDTGNYRVQRFTTDGFFAGEAVSECQGSCFVLGDFGFVTNVAVNSNFFYLLDTDNDLTHVFETTPITDIDDQTMSQSQTAFVKYKSNNNYTGPDAFTFTAFDGLETSNEARVDINVTRNYRAPIATPKLAFAGLEDDEIPLAFSGLDPDEDQLDFDIDTPPANGTVTRTGDTFVYTPNRDFFGTDTFTYVATDAPGSVPALRSEPEPVTIEVAPVNDAPVLTAEPLDSAPIVYDMRLEALLTDVDLDDRHRVAIDWGDGTGSPSDSADITTGASPGKVRILARHAYQSPSDPANPNDRVITICASDLLSAEPMTCASADVASVLALPIVVTKKVDLRIAIDDSLPKNSDPAVPEIQISEPLLDGGAAVTYTVEVLNKVPPTSDARFVAGDVHLALEMPADMNILGVTASVGNCDTAAQSIDCSFGDLADDASVFVAVTAAGSGQLIEEKIVTLQAEATAVQAAVGDENAGSWQTRLLLNGDLDPDGDGVPNRDDAFPGDPAESVDTDQDGIGNNADRDDDNDTLPDRWEKRFGLDSLDAGDRNGDLDGDGLSNEFEFVQGTRPDVGDSDRDGHGDAADNCPRRANRGQYDSNADGRGDLCDPFNFAGAVAIGDADGDGVTDLALLESAGGASTLYTKSGDSNLDIAVFSLLDGTDQPEALATLANPAAPARQAVALVYSDDTGGWHARIHDAWQGSRVADFELFDNSYTFGALAVSKDSNRLVALAAAGDGTLHVGSRDPGTGNLLADMAFFSQIVAPEPLGLAAVGPAAVVVLADDGNGALLAEARDSANGDSIGAWQVPAGNWLQASIAGTGDGFAVLVTGVDGRSTASVLTLQRATPVATFDVFDTAWTPFAMTASTGTSVPSIVVGAFDGNGAIEIRSFDATTGLELNRIRFLSDDAAPRGIALGGDAGGKDSRIGVLASDINGDVSVEQRDAVSGDALGTLTAESVTPPPPPPPPATGGGGSGGGSGGGGLIDGLLLAALVLGLALRTRPHAPSLQLAADFTRFRIAGSGGRGSIPATFSRRIFRHYRMIALPDAGHFESRFSRT